MNKEEEVTDFPSDRSKAILNGVIGAMIAFMVVGIVTFVRWIFN